MRYNGQFHEAPKFYTKIQQQVSIKFPLQTFVHLWKSVQLLSGWVNIVTCRHGIYSRKSLMNVSIKAWNLIISRRNVHSRFCRRSYQLRFYYLHSILCMFYRNMKSLTLLHVKYSYYYKGLRNTFCFLIASTTMCSVLIQISNLHLNVINTKPCFQHSNLLALGVGQPHLCRLCRHPIHVLKNLIFDGCREELQTFHECSRSRAHLKFIYNPSMSLFTILLNLTL